MEAAGAKIGTDFLISYAGDLAMMGILDTHDDWQSLLKANLIGIVVATSSDVADIGKLSYRKDPKVPVTEQPKIDLSDEPVQVPQRVVEPAGETPADIPAVKTSETEAPDIPAETITEQPAKRLDSPETKPEAENPETVSAANVKLSTPETLREDLLDLDYVDEGKLWN